MPPAADPLATSRPGLTYLLANRDGRIFSLDELRTALAVAETELCDGISPRVAPFADVRDLGGLLQRAGFALPVADSEIVTVRYASLF